MNFTITAHCHITGCQRPMIKCESHPVLHCSHSECYLCAQKIPMYKKIPVPQKPETERKVQTCDEPHCKCTKKICDRHNIQFCEKSECMGCGKSKTVEMQRIEDYQTVECGSVNCKCVRKRCDQHQFIFCKSCPKC